MYGKTCIALTITILSMVAAIPLFAQECSGTFSMEMYNLERNGTNQIVMPLYFSNTCATSGIQFTVKTSDGGALEPIGIDTTGGRIGYWDYTSVNRQKASRQLKFVALADWPGGEQTSPLYAGNGLLCNIILRFGCQYDESVQVSITLDSVFISDTTGYYLFEDITMNPGSVYVGNEVNPVVRGDVNCDGHRVGSDVTYLVSYFRNMVDCPCSRCAGDTNGDGNIIGSDVTFLVRYFSGAGSAPSACE